MNNQSSKNNKQSKSQNHIQKNKADKYMGVVPYTPGGFTSALLTIAVTVIGATWTITTFWISDKYEIIQNTEKENESLKTKIKEQEEKLLKYQVYGCKVEKGETDWLDNMLDNPKFKFEYEIK